MAEGDHGVAAAADGAVAGPLLQFERDLSAGLVDLSYDSGHDELVTGAGGRAVLPADRADGAWVAAGERGRGPVEQAAVQLGHDDGPAHALGAGELRVVVDAVRVAGDRTEPQQLYLVGRHLDRGNRLA